jgi:ABC-2 type transport system ATP-binding protein
MIQTRGLTKHYQQIVAVEGIDLSVAPGEVMGLIGPIGAGKTTVIRMLTTLVEPTAGEARVDGLNVATQTEAVRERVGFMSDLFGVYDDMRVVEYFEFFAKAFKIDPNHLGKRINDLLDLAGLLDRREHSIDRLDREMKQRLALVKTLIHDPPVLLLDEPASRLSPPARFRMQELIAKVARGGKTVVIASNILTDLSGLCDRLGVIGEGRLIDQGPAREIVERVAGTRRIQWRLHHPLSSGQTDPIYEALLAESRISQVIVDSQFVEFHIDLTDEDPTPWLEDLIQAHDFGVEAWRELEIDLAPLLERSAATPRKPSP